MELQVDEKTPRANFEDVLSAMIKELNKLNPLERAKAVCMLEKYADIDALKFALRLRSATTSGADFSKLLD